MRDKRRKTPGISLSAAGRHTRLAPGHAGTGKAGTPFWRRTDRHNAPRKAPLWSALSSLLLLWLGVGGTVFAVVTGFDLPVGRGAVALSCAAVPAVVWFLALPLRAARLLRLPALLLGVLRLARSPLKLVFRVAGNAALGFGALWLLGRLAPGLQLGLNLFNGLLIGVLGLPGFGLLLLLQWVL